MIAERLFTPDAETRTLTPDEGAPPAGPAFEAVLYIAQWRAIQLDAWQGETIQAAPPPASACLTPDADSRLWSVPL